MSNSEAVQKLDAKFAELKGYGVEFGNLISEKSAYGGTVRQYERGAIYWHPQVAQGSANAVWGGIYERYKALGAHDVNANTQSRLFGFPTSDEKWDDNFIRRVSEFEFGAIYWINEGAPIFGLIYNAWKDEGGTSSELGYPIGELLNYHGGHAVYFERGCMWSGQKLGNKVLRAYARYPQLGKPKIVNPSSPSDVGFKNMISFFGVSGDEVKQLNSDFHPGMGNFFSNLWKNKLSIMRVTKLGEPEDDLIPLNPIDFSVWGGPGGVTGVNIHGHGFVGPDVEPLPDIRGPGGLGDHSGVRPVSASDPGLDPNINPNTGAVTPTDPTPTANVLEPGAIGPTWDDINEPPHFLSFAIPDGSILKNRGLYDIVIVNLPGNRPTFAVSPNSIYVRKDWTNFGMIHATDLHVNMRSDYIGNILRRAANDPDIGSISEWAKGADKYTNWNDSFRDMIKYANKLYDQGALDIILATGDLIDYVFTHAKEIPATGRYSHSGGNFLYFEKIVLGQSPSPDEIRKTTNERLRVPMFTILGNHDYRENEYEIRAKVEDPITGSFTINDVKQYFDHNLNEDEGVLMSLGVEQYKYIVSYNNQNIDSALPLFKYISAATAAESVIVTNAHVAQNYYRAKINRENSYVLKLGQHRIVMIDVKHDIGIPSSSDTSALLKFLWEYERGDEDITVAAGGGPNSKGFTDFDLDLTQRAIAEAKSVIPKGLVIVGIHNGPINFVEGHHMNLFRTTVHPHLDPKWVKGYFTRYSSDASSPELDLASLAEAGWLFSDTPYFKTGSNDSYLNYGIAKEKSNEFMRICAGEAFESGKNVDLVLYGHHHQHEEYVIKWLNQDMNELAYYTDFFTHNPSRYYSSPHVKYGEKAIRIRVKDGADPSNVEPIMVGDTDSETGEFFKYWQLDTPPFNDPLNMQNNKAEWWRIHSPLYLQTAALGARDTYGRLVIGKSDMSYKDLLFQGIRAIYVMNNIIVRIDTVNLESMRKYL